MNEQDTRRQNRKSDLTLKNLPSSVPNMKGHASHMS